MIYNHQKLNQILVAFAVFSFLLMSYAALFNFSMPMDGKMDTSHCPFMEGTSICSMSPLDHVSAWHSVFSNIVHETYPLALILLAYVVFSFFVSSLFKSPPKILGRSLRFLFNERYTLFSALQVAYSHGILNPKLF